MGQGALCDCASLTTLTLPFVGSRRGNSGTKDSVFGYIFGTASYTGGQQTTQCYDGPENSPSIVYYIPTSLKSVTITAHFLPGDSHLASLPEEIAKRVP